MKNSARQEIRFALVLYGGVSLAIYMNGVVQEFLRLVRGSTGFSLCNSTESVYRELAELTGARFVVDIASGSSAGGINAVFLGKALANGQSLDGLAKLWLDAADLGRLWNRERAPKSFLDGRYFFDKLIGALNAMDEAGSRAALQPSMDVFITATDLQGLDLPIELADMTLDEKRHKNVFHFSFTDGLADDFARERNPFLAFAARATSSFPFAFEPVRLADSPPSPGAEVYFQDYAADYSNREFADGGLLNNKPFSHAIRQLPRGFSDLPARRVLVYVEPSPDEPESPGLLGLHRLETIREDLERLLERNRLIERVREIADPVERDVREWQHAALRRPGHEYASRTIADEIHERGPGYAGYHRLKVRAVTDDLAGIVMRAAAVRDTEAAARTIAKMIRDWRARTYSECDARNSESRFLLEFDLGYRLRRVRFLIAKLDELGGQSELRAELNRVAQELKQFHVRCHQWGSRNFAFDAVQSRDADCVATALRPEFRRITERAAADLERCLAGHPLKAIFDHYEYYDQVTFPVLYETQVGEPEHVDVFRISPRDARSLIDEQSPDEPRRKLAGTALFHFGAFLKRDWRVNDMLWGRLDGAERIISAVLPAGSADAARLIRQAHLAIMKEMMGGSENMMTGGEETRAGDEETMERCEASYEYLRERYEVSRKLGFLQAAKLAARAIWVARRMAGGIARGRLHLW